MYTTLPFSFTLTLEVLFFALLFVFSMHAFFLAYHWFTFGENRKTATTALASYLCGGAVLFLTFAIQLYIA